MTKKKHASKLFSVGVVLAMVFALTLCIGMRLTVLAAETESENKVTAAAITKNLQMDQNVTTPEATFTFDVEKVSLDGSTIDEDLGKMPIITVTGLSFSSTDTGTTNATGLKEVKKETGNIIPDISDFSHAGVYKYKVIEQQSGYSGTADTSMTYSRAEFNMDIYVKNKDDNSGLEIDGVYVNYVKDDDGNAKTGKVDPTPGTASDVSKWQFVNKFSKMNTVAISKTVAGAMGDRKKQFDFSLSLVGKSVLEAAGKSYTGTIERATGSSASTQTDFSLKEGTDPAKFTLADGEVLTLALPVGTTCIVTETSAGNYTTTVDATSNGVPEEQKESLTSGNVLVGENTNSVTFTNTKDSPIPTGIVMDNLPFLILILVALFGFAGYIVLKRRKYRG